VKKIQGILKDFLVWKTDRHYGMPSALRWLIMQVHDQCGWSWNYLGKRPMPAKKQEESLNQSGATKRGDISVDYFFIRYHLFIVDFLIL
jgi:hypothetical protein